MQLLIDAIYALPMEVCHSPSASLIDHATFFFSLARARSIASCFFQATTDGNVIPLPAPTTHLPRSQPVPKPKPLTRWQKFAAEKVRVAPFSRCTSLRCV